MIRKRTINCGHISNKTNSHKSIRVGQPNKQNYVRLQLNKAYKISNKKIEEVKTSQIQGHKEQLLLPSPDAVRLMPLLINQLIVKLLLFQQLTATFLCCIYIYVCLLYHLHFIPHFSYLQAHTLDSLLHSKFIN